MILLNRTCFGRLDSSIAYFPKVEWFERVPALVLFWLILLLGVQPNWMLRWSEATTTAMVATAPPAAVLQVAAEVDGQAPRLSHTPPRGELNL